jgi:hypothetical protein
MAKLEAATRNKLPINSLVFSRLRIPIFEGSCFIHGQSCCLFLRQRPARVLWLFIPLHFRPRHLSRLPDGDASMDISMLMVRPPASAFGGPPCTCGMRSRSRGLLAF